MRPTPVILNPIAGGGRLLRYSSVLQKVAAGIGVDLEIRLTESTEHTTRLAAEAAEQGEPLVFAYGGDGTYNAVARGLLGSSTAMGVLPGGTTSVLAYEFDIPRPATRALAALLRGRDRAMRVGRSDRGDLVLLMLSAGPDSHVLERVRPSFKRLGGRVGVGLQAIVEVMGSTDLPRIRVVTPGSTNEAGWAIIGNSRCYGGPVNATPGADPFRADLEIVAQLGFGRRAAIGFVLGLPSGRHLRRSDVVRDTVTTVRLEAAPEDRKISYQVDGDVVGVLPVTVGIDPESLMVRLPASSG